MTQDKDSDKLARMALNVEGRIQGVGFRPFVWRLARELGLTGKVFNSSAGVRIEAQGMPAALNEFERRLLAEQPPLAEIGACERIALLPQAAEEEFIIAASSAHAGQKVLVSPDVGVCADCLADMRDKTNHRHGYAFTNCVNCGPRFSITRHIPYDRPATVMACFPLCPTCEKEYGNPADRRFHAQPIACPQCGPRLWLAMAGKENTLPDGASSANVIARAAGLLAEGKILALKGLGGYQLACDATNATAIAELRKRKRRPHKAFALMSANLESAARICVLSPGQSTLLESPARPIVLCEARKTAALPESLAPDSDELGLMLPNTPMHALLFDELEKYGMDCLVMTSGNKPGEPICLGNREALGKLAGIADAWLMHDRDILCRVDDSVVSAGKAHNGGAPIFIRRARGYVPEALQMPPAEKQDSILGAGAQMKATFCLTRLDKAFISQHIGDLDSPDNLDFYEESLAHMQRLLEAKPAAIVRDLHPDYLSSQFALELAKKNGLPLWSLQHHAAHAASVLAENAIFGPALALCLDGTGLGTNGAIWGGELLEMNLGAPRWRRLGTFSNFPLPGGETAIRQPWRIALAFEPDWRPCAELTAEAEQVRKILRNGHANASASSCGRLFDAVSARLGLCQSISYEGQAAMRLMLAAGRALKEGLRPPGQNGHLIETPGLIQLDSKKIYESCAEICDSKGPNMAALAFHLMLADNLAEMCKTAALNTQIEIIGLSGGVFQNGILAEMLVERLKKMGLQPIQHRKLPCGDGGLAFGQAIWGRQLLNNGAKSE